MGHATVQITSFIYEILAPALVTPIANFQLLSRGTFIHNKVLAKAQLFRRLLWHNYILTNENFYISHIDEVYKHNFLIRITIPIWNSNHNYTS